jgi:hypothetical protein
VQTFSVGANFALKNWPLAPTGKFARVTGLGELYYIGRLLPFGSCFENYQSNPHLYATFYHVKSYLHITFDKKWVGLHFGRFFHNLIRSH